MSVVPDRLVFGRGFDWQGITHPGLDIKDLVIYEVHTRGFTRSPDSGVTEWDLLAGTFLGFVEKIPHLLELGINCVELLPVFEFDETACPRTNPATDEQLCNYWGYSTVAFFVPMQRFCARPQVSASITEFKTLVRELHRVGIEVILDVAFNHTAEGTWGESNWHSLAAIDKEQYYLLSNGYDTNYTGCGNTINANQPLCSEWICDCLCYWVMEMQVDGFRFDLASTLTRGPDGQILAEPPLIQNIVSDPRLSHVKLIAEPWDCSYPSGYLVGRFPSCGPPRFAEWNGSFRDTARSFIKGDIGMKGQFATRMSGSSDLFGHDGRRPCHSINFVTCHDGFTLRDLVSFNEKHNECNGESSGEDHNKSWNCGAEGLHSEESAVDQLRARQMRNLLVAVLLSVGTPMVTAGDEYGRTQRGNNNGWCQDNATSWFDWGACRSERDGLFRFCRLLIALRKHYSHIFCRTEFLTVNDVWWRTYWDDPYNYLCYVLHDKQDSNGYSGLLVAFNAGHEERSCDLPANGCWHRLLDTNLAPPLDICEDERVAMRITTPSYAMEAYSCIVLKNFASNDSGASASCDFHASEPHYAGGQNLELVAAHLRNVVSRTMLWELPASQADPEPSRSVSQLLLRRGMMSGSSLTLVGSTEDLPSEDAEPRVRLTFQVNCASTKLGESVVVVGSLPELGAWDPERAVPCSTTAEAFPGWRSRDVSVPAERCTEPVEFKLLVGGGGWPAVWEEGCNRLLHLPVVESTSLLATASCTWGEEGVSMCVGALA